MQDMWGKTFCATKGTMRYRLRASLELVKIVVTLLAHGCPLQAIKAAYGLDERTIANWQHRAGQHCEQVHQHLVEHPREVGQVPADELRVKPQGEIVWLAMAVQVNTRPNVVLPRGSGIGKRVNRTHDGGGWINSRVIPSGSVK